jgi:N4-gp56 family major capsid protein
MVRHNIEGNKIMAATDFGSLTAAQKKVWAVETWQQGRDSSFWFANGFIGKNQKDMNSPIHRVTDLTTTERGRECVMQLVADLEGDGVVDDNELEGNEESLINDSQTISISQLRHGVRSKGKMAEQETVIRFRAQARGKLTFWISDKTDELMFLTVAGRAYTLNTDGSTRSGTQLSQLKFASDVVAASTNRIIHAGTATSEATITASDTMSWNLISKACAFAKRKKLRPIRSGGKEYLAMIMSTEQARDLRADDDYQTIVKTAGPRGSKNPLFTGAFAVVDGVVLHEHNKTFNTLGLASGSRWGSGSTIHGAQAQIFGSQAAALALIGSAQMAESDNTDYGNRAGISFGRMFGMLKPQYRSEPDSGTTEDFGTVAVKTAAAV